MLKSLDNKNNDGEKIMSMKIVDSHCTIYKILRTGLKPWNNLEKKWIITSASYYKSNKLQQSKELTLN